MDYKNLDLSELSCYAAGEIDDYILNRNKEFDATNELISRMERFSKEKLIEIDPTEGLIYERLFKEKLDLKTAKISDLQLKISQATQELNSIKTLPKKRLKTLRTFCLNISNEALAYEDYTPSYLAA